MAPVYLSVETFWAIWEALTPSERADFARLVNARMAWVGDSTRIVTPAK